MLARAYEEAKQLGDSFISTGALLADQKDNK